MLSLNVAKVEATRRRLAWDIGLVALLFLGAFALRYARIKETVWGDEALYYYLARTWGFDRSWVIAPDNTAAQIAFRPAFFALYFPVAQLGLEAVRTCNVLAGCAIVGAAYVVSRCLGAPRLPAVLAGAIVAIHPEAARFSSTFFPDTTMTILAIVALGFVARGRFRLAALLMSLSVMSKEVGIAVAAGLVGGVVLQIFAPASDAHLERGRERAQLSAAWPLLLPFVMFAATQALGIFVFEGRMQGWSQNPLTAEFLDDALIGPTFIPAVVTLALRRRWVPLLAGLALPAFYVLWTSVGGRGVEGWYQVSMVPFAAVTCACASAEWIAAVPPSWRTGPRYATSVALALLPALVVPWSGWLKGDRMPWETQQPDQLATVADALKKLRPKQIGLVSCFWAYAYYPLRTPGARVTRWFPKLDDVGRSSEMPDGIRNASVAVLCEAAAERYRTQAPAGRKCTLASTPNYEIIRDPGSCLSFEASPDPGSGDASGKGRAYNASDMRTDECVTHRNGILEGRGCAGRIVIFGPYADAPAGAVVELTFRIRTETAVRVSVDVVSDLGRRSYGGTSVKVEPNEHSEVLYRVEVPEAAHGLEARVAVSAKRLIRFEVGAFALAIHPK